MEKHSARFLNVESCCHLFGSVIFVVLAFGCDGSLVFSQEAGIDFVRDIRPILSDHCFACHGPDAEKREGGLRLDLRETAFAGGDSGPAVVGGDLAKSHLWQRIIATEPSERMPPVDSGKELKPAQIELLKRWINDGANWSEHWGFVSPTRPALPLVKRPATTHPIDTFVQAKLESEGMTLSEEAEKRTLARRLYLDLIGLPPTPEELERFLKDESADAYARLVDQLLESPHYGEKWARHWLDAARYADSDGFEKDKPREVWFYRDYVIRAFNENKPYDQFVIEQTAGDLLPSPTQDQIVATGFLRNSMLNEEGGVDPEQFRMEAMFDRMDAVGKAILGLTIHCAQCHSHKYDPLTHDEYYQMFAYLNNSYEGQVAVFTPDQKKSWDEIQSKIDASYSQLEKSRADWKGGLEKWIKEHNSIEQLNWENLELTFDDKSIGGQKFLRQSDESYLAQSYAPTKFRPLMIAQPKTRKIASIRLEMLTDPNLPHQGPGRSPKGTYALTEFEFAYESPTEPGKMIPVDIAKAVADVNPQRAPLDSIYDDKSGKERVTGPIEFAFDKDDLTAWGNNLNPAVRNQPHQAIFILKDPIELAEGKSVHIYLKQMHGGWNSDDNQTNNLGRFRISVTSEVPTQANLLPPSIAKILHKPMNEWSTSEQSLVFRAWAASQDDLKRDVEQFENELKNLPEVTTQLVMWERTEARATHVLDRGNFLKPKEKVTRGTPKFLHPLPEGEANDRLGFAKWLVDRKSPTTARAFVNRIWQVYFGVGLTATSEDLGSQGEAPSHPELLDWLATEFMDSNWNIKHLQRLIVTSETYKQSSKVTAEGLAKDPYNRLLGRGARFRVDAEVVRDIALASSGLLNREVGGPSVYPPAPEFLFVPPASYGPKIWKKAEDESKYRRALYTFRFRSVPYPALQAFDAPNADAACARRVRSNTPLQALTSLNEPLFMECAQSLAKLTQKNQASFDGALQEIYERVVARTPREEEAKVLEQLYTKNLEGFTERLKQLSSPPDSDDFKRTQFEFASLTGISPEELIKLDKDEIAELGARVVIARVVLNLDEAISHE